MTPILAALGAWFDASGPAVAVAATLGAFALGGAVAARCDRHPAANPTLIAVVLVAGLLLATGADYGAYLAHSAPLHVLLGPAVVALAVPLYRFLPLLRAEARTVALALLAGSLVAILSVLGIAAALGATHATLVSLAPKSATAAVSTAISASTGGLPTLTALVTVLTGVTGAVAVPPLLDRLGISAPTARGLAMGLAGHGIATARAFGESQETGAASALAMGLNAILTAALVPPLITLALG